jgi:tRNA(Glu) U13 pseudouridine synthase TruD
MDKFDDPRCFLPSGMLDFLTNARIPQRFRIPESLLQKWPGILKSTPADFVVTEPVPAYPGLKELFARGIMVPSHRFLTIGTDSDMPGLLTDRDLTVTYRGQTLPAVAFTAVKTCESTWRMTDMVANHLSNQLKRTIGHQQILTSGLKDRTAVTAQTMVVVGVSMTEMSKVDWSGFQPGRQGVFVKDIRPTDRLLDLGDHLANHFEITIRLPGKTRQAIEDYVYSRALVLERLRFRVPNAFHMQRLGPTQDNQRWGRTLLTGRGEPPQGVKPFTSNIEAMLFQLLCSANSRGSVEVSALREELQKYWQFNYPKLEQTLRNRYRRLNLTLEYEVAKRLADPRFNGSADVFYDLRDRLSIAVGAWQAVYWNWTLGAMLDEGRLDPDSREGIPLAFSCDQSREFYGRSEIGRQCLEELAVTEQLAARAEPFLHAAIDHYWQTNNIGDTPDKFGLSMNAVRSLFSGVVPPGTTRPARRELSAALVRHLCLVPRDLRTGAPKPFAPTRDAFMRVSDFAFRCEDQAVTLRFALRSGAYATMLIGLLFDTSDPEEDEPDISCPSDGAPN